MVDIGNLIGNTYHSSLQRIRLLPFGMAEDAVLIERILKEHIMGGNVLADHVID